MSVSGPSIASVAPSNDRRQTLLAIRDRLAHESDDVKWAKHRRECNCVCGAVDIRALVALVKELRAVEAEIAELPPVEGGHPIDGIVASVASLDQHRRTRTTRRPDTKSS